MVEEYFIGSHLVLLFILQYMLKKEARAST